MFDRAHRLVSLLLAVVLALATIVVSGSTNASADDLVQFNPAMPCQDVVVLAARGSDEPPGADWVGDTLRPIVTEYVNRVDSDLRVAVDGIIYPAQDVEAIWLLPTGNNSYFDGLSQGVSTALDDLKGRDTRCPQERYVLMGYSQGAMVMHRVARQLAQDRVSPGSRNGVSALADRIDGVLVVGDGDRVANEGGLHFGTDASPEGRNRYGVGTRYAAVSKTVTKKLPAQYTDGYERWFSVCNAGDLVCDYMVAWFNGLSIHTSYGRADWLPALQKVVENSLRAPRVAIGATQGRVAETFTSEVRVEGGGQNQVRVSGLVSGLVFDTASREIRGVPKKAGKYQFRVTVTTANGPVVVMQTEAEFVDELTAVENLDASRQGATVTLTWQPPAHVGSTRVVGYVVTRGDTAQVVRLPATSLTVSFTDVASGAVTFRVQAVGKNGSTSTAAVTAEEPDAPLVAKQVSYLFDMVCATRQDGRVECSDIPVWSQVAAPRHITRLGENLVSGLKDVLQATQGWNPQLCAVNDAGALWCGDREETKQIMGGLPPVKEVAGQEGTWCAVSQAGEVWCWGANGSGQVGDGTTVDRGEPAKVSGLTGVQHVSLSPRHACASTSDGAVYCWGANESGQLGDGTTQDHRVPVRVMGLPAATSVAVGTARPSWPPAARDTYSCATTQTREVFCWGSNAQLILGTNGSDSYSADPVRVAGLSEVKQIAVGYGFACALTDHAQVNCWGTGHNGELGQGTDQNDDEHLDVVSAVPLQVKGLADIVTLSQGSGTGTCAIDSAAQMWCWGGEPHD